MRNLEDIKRIPIASYLERKGIIVPARGNIAAYWRGDRNPSVHIDSSSNCWYDHGTGKGGSIIDLVMTVERCGFTQAVEMLEYGSFQVASSSTTLHEEREPAFIIDEVLRIKHPALYRYLNSRGISSNIAYTYCKEIHYHLARKPESRFFAIGFQQINGGWELRNAKIKLATAKCYSYIDNGGTHLVVFEGFIDFLSYIEIPDAVFDKRQHENYLVLNSVAMADRMLNDLESGKLGNITSATLCLDADEAGRSTSMKIGKELEDMNIRVTEDIGAKLKAFGHGVKDINDALLCYQQQMRKNQSDTL